MADIILNGYWRTQMIRIIDGRATGKTSRLMLLAKERNAIVVCKDPETFRKKATYDYGIVGIDFISYNEYIYDVINSKGSKYRDREIFIDELEMFISKFGKIAGYTISED